MDNNTKSFWLTVIDKDQIDSDGILETGVSIVDQSESIADLKQFVDQLNAWGVPAAIVLSEGFDAEDGEFSNDVVYSNEKYNEILSQLIEQMMGDELKDILKANLG